MEILIKRIAKRSTYTIGRLFVDGERVCDTIEDTDRGLTSAMKLEDLKRKKIKGKTAIPIGSYRLEQHYSQKFAKRPYGVRYNGIFPMLVNVKAFDAILIHPGTDETDTEGCVIVGLNKVVGKVLNSRDMYYKLMDEYIVPAWNRGEVVIVTIQ